MTLICSALPYRKPPEHRPHPAGLPAHSQGVISSPYPHLSTLFSPHHYSVRNSSQRGYQGHSTALPGAKQPRRKEMGADVGGRTENRSYPARLLQLPLKKRAFIIPILGGKMKKRVDHCLTVPSRDTQRVQECHIAVGHVLCECIEDLLF